MSEQSTGAESPLPRNRRDSFYEHVGNQSRDPQALAAITAAFENMSNPQAVSPSEPAKSIDGDVSGIEHGTEAGSTDSGLPPRGENHVSLLRQALHQARDQDLHSS